MISIFLHNYLHCLDVVKYIFFTGQMLQRSKHWISVKVDVSVNISMTSTLMSFIFFKISSGLKNDHLPETFYLKYTIDNNMFPCRYVKIGRYGHINI